MKNIIACIVVILTYQLSFATETSTSSSIKNVTVFLNGAQVNREANFNLKKGLNLIAFDSLSPFINSNSIQVSGIGNFIILDTKYRLVQPDYNSPKKIPEKYTQQQVALQDSIDIVNFDLEDLKNKKDVLTTEKQLLISNGSMKSDSLALLKDALAFFREKYNNINSTLISVKKEEYKVEKRLKKLTDKLTELNKEIAQLFNKPLKPNHKVVVTIQSDFATAGKVKLNYLVSNASWSPSYDLRANNTNEPVELTFKANIYQNTGEKWDNVNLKLSTNNPNKSKTKPVLSTWYLNYYNPELYYQKNTAYGGLAQPSRALKEVDDLFDEEQEKIAQSSAMYSNMAENFTNIEYNISIPYTITSDGENHVIAIKEEELKANYQYYLVPKMDANAFLVASINGFEDLNLLPAATNIYFAGTYIGQTMINPQITGDSLNIDLGREERITAQRKLIKKDEKDQLLGNEKTKQFNYNITVKNNLLNNISLVVEDQIPVANDKDIKVELKDKSKAEFKESTGALVWRFDLASKSSKKIDFTYQVQYQKDKSLALN